MSGATIRAQAKQAAMISCPANEVLYGGARGGGKSFATLLDWHRHRSRWGGKANGILFRRSMPELEDMLNKARKLYPATGGTYATQARTWQWPDGSWLKLRYLERDADADRYQGHEYNWMAFEEAGAWSKPDALDMLRATLRSADGVRHRLVLTANPGGVGHNWLKARYVDPRPPMRVHTDGDGWSVCYIPATVADNPILIREDPGYIARLRQSAPSPAILKAWLEGSWDIVAGGIFDDLWNREKHVLPVFDVPQSWRIDRSFDWGSSKPFSVGWWAESNGETAIIGGKPRTFPRGSLIRVGEWYGWSGKPNDGARMLAVDIARGILERELSMGWRARVKVGVADSAIFATENGNCIADDMARIGVRWEPADKSPGSRINGWQMVRKMLKAAGEDRPEDAGLWAVDSCTHYIRTLPTLPRDARKPDDVDSDAEDHCADEVRYRCSAVRKTPSFARVLGV